MAVTDRTTSAGLLAFCKFMARRPANDAEMTDDEWYTLLSLGQEQLYEEWMVHFPEWLLNDWTALTTTDEITYTLTSEPWIGGGVMVRVGLDGPLLKPATRIEDDGDFVPMNDGTIRMVKNKARTFSDTLYARWVEAPGDIDGSNPPTLKPAHARELIAYKALILWSYRPGGRRSPDFFTSLYQRRLEGDPRIASEGGLMLALKNAYFAAQGEHVSDMAYLGGL